jgi:hypothetical protein
MSYFPRGLALMLGFSLFAAVTLSSSHADQTTPASVIRPLPYPFHHVVSFSDDTDELKPWHEMALHRVFNEEMGLPISDAIWPHGSDRLSTLFLGPNVPNRTPSGVDDQPTFALLLREWHRGNIDQFHGWNEDSTYQLRNDLSPALKLSSPSVVLPIPETDPAIVDEQRQNIRVYFSGELPTDLTIRLHDSLGQSLTFDEADIQKALRVQVKAAATDRFADFLIPRKPKSPQTLALNLGRLTDIEFKAPSCANGCALAITKIIRDDFSRQTVLGEAPDLAKWNIRPTLLTSHGGNTLNQDFGVAGRVLEVPRTPGTLFANASVVVRREPQATNQTSHAYHADILKTLGIDGVWAYFPERKSDYFGPLSINAGDPPRSMTSSFEGFYNIPRTNPGEFDRSSPEAFAKDIEKLLPFLSYNERLDLYCGVNCDSAQGDALALLIATSVEKITHGETVEHFWYTHFGSRGSKYDHTIEEPLTPVTKKWLTKLVNLVYNFDGTVPERQRVWSPPASTWVRYQMMQSHIAEHLHVSADGHVITIDPWKDPVTGRILPDPRAGSRDLHGLTLYVSDPAKARVFIADRELTTFTRNKADLTGRASITLVDDHAPTAMIDRVSLRDKGTVSEESGTISENTIAPTNGEPYGVMSLTADQSGNAEMIFQPSGLALWNTSHIGFQIRKLAASTGRFSSNGVVEIDFLMKNGDTISINEATSPDSAFLPSSQWAIPPLSADGQWRHETLATTELDWPDHYFGKQSNRRPPLPLGQVRAIRIALSDAAPFTKLEIANLRALRADPNGEADDGSHVLFGRVTENGRKGLAGIKIKAATQKQGTLKAVTDQDGYFTISNIADGEIVSIKAQIDGRLCAPERGRRIEILKNEAELDIRSDLCHQMVSATEAALDQNIVE